jgi:hypothetical protein
MVLAARHSVSGLVFQVGPYLSCGHMLEPKTNFEHLVYDLVRRRLPAFLRSMR